MSLKLYSSKWVHTLSPGGHPADMKGQSCEFSTPLNCSSSNPSVGTCFSPHSPVSRTGLQRRRICCPISPGMTNEDVSSLEQFTQSWTSREPPRRKYLSWAGRAAAGKQGEAQDMFSTELKTVFKSTALPCKLAKKRRRLLNVDISAMEGNAAFKIPSGSTENAESSSRSVLSSYIHLSNSQGQPQLGMRLDMQSAKHKTRAAEPRQSRRGW